MVEFRKKHLVGFFVIFIIAIFVLGHFTKAETIDDLRKSIDAKNAEIKKLEEDIKKSRQELATTQNQGQTLKAEITRLNNEIKKLTNSIALTKRQIEAKTLEIQALGLDIDSKEKEIAVFRSGLAGLVQTVFQNDRVPMVTLLLKYDTVSQFFRFLGYADLLQSKIVNSVETLRTLKNELTARKNDSESKKSELVDLSKQLTVRVSAEAATKTERSTLLALTKNQEKNYQVLLKVQESRRASLEGEIRDIEAKIRITIDPSTLPSQRHGVLGGPLPNVGLLLCSDRGGNLFKNCVTQFFGNTAFAAGGTYGGKGHNGVDFRADIGTPVLAAESGVVAGVGDTDVGCKGASYGKWVLITHQNNLSTLYGHLSLITVFQGQSLKRGEEIALSGQTGYATGPHLHFGVYASQAVSVESIRSKVCGRLMTLPISAINGYLDPMSYL